MYNANSLEQFIDKVNKEAEEAAQAVYNKYNKELNTRVAAQLNKGDKLRAGMGIVSITKNGNQVGEKLSDVLCSTQYWDKVNAGFDLEDIEK